MSMGAGSLSDVFEAHERGRAYAWVSNVLHMLFQPYTNSLLAVMKKVCSWPHPWTGNRTYYWRLLDRSLWMAKCILVPGTSYLLCMVHDFLLLTRDLPQEQNTSQRFGSSRGR